jgi:hypothetical protein
VATSFLPVRGGVAQGQSTVPALQMINNQPLEYPQPRVRERLAINSSETLRFVTLSTFVYLTTSQAEDPELAAARDLLGRAAGVIGRLEDAVIFNGIRGADQPPELDGDPLVLPEIYEVNSNGLHPGLLREGVQPLAQAALQMWLTDPNNARSVTPVEMIFPTDDGFSAKPLIDGLVQAVQRLEGRGHYGPFACVLGQTLYLAAHTPDPGSLVLPSDRITPFLNGPLLRSSTISPNLGIVVSLSGATIDVVFASDIHVRFVQINLEPRFVLRVSERFVLRVKQADAAETLVFNRQPAVPAQPAGQQPAGQQAGGPRPEGESTQLDSNPE